MLQLKLTHTMHVVKDSKLIMQGEKWNKESTPIGEVSALLHDIGRFSQFNEFGTFRDAESVDHAQRGIEIISRANILEGVSLRESQQIENAISWHNKKLLPQQMDKDNAKLAYLVRDADKLDIFRVIESAVEDGSIENTPELSWGLDIRGTPNPEVVEAVIKGEPVDYAKIHSLSDFILIHLGWIISGFHNKTALRIARDRKVVDFRQSYLKTLTSSPCIERCCQEAFKALDF